MSTRWKNITIGGLVVAAVAVTIWGLLFLHPHFGDGGHLLRVRFSNIDKIGIGTRVTYAGRPVGEVIAINLIPTTNGSVGACKPGDTSNTIFTYEVTLRLDSHVQVYDCDDISVRTSGLMGERNIAITPQRSPTGIARLLANNELVYATTSGSIEDAFSTLNALSKKAEQAIDDVIRLIETNQAEFQKAVASIDAAAQEFAIFGKRANDADVIGSLVNVTAHSVSTLQQLENTLTAFESSKTIDHIASATQSLSNITASLDRPEQLANILDHTAVTANNLAVISNRLGKTIPQLDTALQSTTKLIDNITEGKGTAGRLLCSDDLYFKTAALMNKLDTIVTDVNNYGVLFHLDKGWQRDRRKRLQALQDLSTPAELRNYLNGELQEITLSISRLNIALQRTNDTSLSTATTHDEFQRTFDELIGLVQGLETTLKDYQSASVDENISTTPSP